MSGFDHVLGWVHEAAEDPQALREAFEEEQERERFKRERPKMSAAHEHQSMPTGEEARRHMQRAHNIGSTWVNVLNNHRAGEVHEGLHELEQKKSSVREARRPHSFQERQALIDEQGEAKNKTKLDLAGTHYERKVKLDDDSFDILMPLFGL